MKFKNIIVSEKSYSSPDLYDIVYSNITVVNLLREENVTDDLIHPDSLISYFIDYYLAQSNNGGFSQFVYNSRWNHDLNSKIELGLETIGAIEHLKYFRRQKQVVESINPQELISYFQSEYFGENETRDKLKNDAYFDIEENLIDLNGKWLRNHSDLKVLTIDNMFKEFEKHIGREIEK